jgi:signal transduction histidine kinase
MLTRVRRSRSRTTDRASRPPNALACSNAEHGSTSGGDGAGLGLAIVQDVLSAYRWRLVLAGSELGGLKAIVAPETAHD